MIGLTNLGRVGRSKAAARIEAAGRAFQAKNPESPTPAEPCTPVPPAAVGLHPPHPETDRTLLPGRCREIMAEVAEKYGVPVTAIVSKSKSRKYLRARFEAIFRCVAETELSLGEIGRIFRRDHSTIGAAVMRHHRLTGAPLPRGMNWLHGSPDYRKRHDELRRQRRLREEISW